MCMHIYIYIYIGSVTFQIIGDNVDVHQKPRYMTADHKSRDYHWFHLYTVKNRINVGECTVRVIKKVTLNGNRNAHNS